MKNITLLSGIAVIATLLGSCNLSSGSDDISDGNPTTMTPSEILSFQKVFMSSYYAERGGAPSEARALTPFLESRSKTGSRATIAVDQLGDTTFANLVLASTEPVDLEQTSLANYPEPGQTTTFTAVAIPEAELPAAALRVYNITATTTYPATDLRKNYVEEYYVQDIGFNATLAGTAGISPDGIWTTDDLIVKKDEYGTWVQGPAYSTHGLLAQDQKARVRQVLTFQDGTTRNETILATNDSNGYKFDPAAFDIDGSLDLNQAFIPAVSTSPNTQYSSVVYYHVNPWTNPNFWFWQGSNAQTILGIRYYTEEKDTGADTLTTYTVAFEKTLSTLTTTGGTFATTLTDIYAGSVHDTLAESVLRQKVVYTLLDNGLPDLNTGQITSNMKTRVVNISGQKDFYLTQIDDESVALATIDSTIYVPTGDVTEVLAADTSALTFVRDQQTTGTTTDGIFDFASTVADASGLGDLATLYRSIITGAATISTPTAPASNLMATTGVVASFNGQQSMGTIIEASDADAIVNNMGAAGTVEAWVYINVQTNTAGIVHKGVRVDFLDECFSLQGWGNDGTFTILLNRPAAVGGGYDQLIAKTKLNTKKWYHIVATWDTTLGSKDSFIKIYLNGDLNKSMKPASAVLETGYTENLSAVLVGSQLPESYSAAYGYFGLNGKVAGANVMTTAMPASEVLDKYNASKDNTVNW